MEKIILNSERVVVGVTGASGSLYAELLLQQLLRAQVRTYLVVSETARKVIATELTDRCSLLASALASNLQIRLESNDTVKGVARALEIPDQNLEQLKVFSNDDFYAPIASGSEGATHMVVAPCSMGSLARIAHGMSTCLLERCADVMLKERRSLVICPRETPVSAIHLQNMITLIQAGASIVPAMPAFYNRPQSIDDLAMFVVERLLDQLQLSALKDFKKVRWNVRRL